MEAISTKELTKVYRPPQGLKRLMVKSPIKQPIVAVDKVDLAVGRGELFALIGPNGAGKTTLIKMLATLLLPTSGEARVNGFDVISDEDKVKASIGFVSGEERSFYWRLTGRENLLFFAALHNLGPRDAAVRVDRALKIMRLERAAGDMYYSYSSGMKQKLLLARGLLTDPQILFLDEPTKSVDPITSREIKELISEQIVARSGRTVILTSHRLEEVEELCDRLAVMEAGRLRFMGSVAELKNLVNKKDRWFVEINDPDERLVESLRLAYGIDLTVSASGPRQHKLEFSLDNGSDDVSGIITRICAGGGRIVAFDRRRPTLEDMFVDLLESSVN